MRLASIVGEAGIFQTLCILMLCDSCTFLTSLSLSAIVTNGKIRSGGAYYILSRSLGPATGGAIGILYFFALSFAAAMYILGATEAFQISTHIKLGP